MIKRIAIILGILVLVGGCNFLPDLRDDIREGAVDAAGEVTDRVEEVGSQIRKTKESVERKVENVRGAIREVSEAIEAVGNLTDGEDVNGADTTDENTEVGAGAEESGAQGVTDGVVVDTQT